MPCEGGRPGFSRPGSGQLGAQGGVWIARKDTAPATGDTVAASAIIRAIPQAARFLEEHDSLTEGDEGDLVPSDIASVSPRAGRLPAQAGDNQPAVRHYVGADHYSDLNPLSAAVLDARRFGDALAGLGRRRGER
jgi:hypothetical protein